MTCVPEELEKFYVAARPKGKTAIVVIDGSVASFYDKRGYELWRV